MRKVDFAGNEMTIIGEQVKVGDKAQDFTVTLQDFSEFKLSSLEDKIVIITVFPSIDTSVCALQTKHFNRQAAKLGDDIVTLSVSVDLPPALGRFCAGKGIDNLIATSDYKTKDFSTKYGFLIEEMQILARGTLIIGKDGIVKYAEYVDHITDEPNYTATLECLSSLI